MAEQLEMAMKNLVVESFDPLDLQQRTALDSMFPSIAKSKAEQYLVAREQQDFLVNAAMSAPSQISSEQWLRLVLIIGGAEPLKQHDLVAKLYGGFHNQNAGYLSKLKNAQWGLVSISTLFGSGAYPGPITPTNPMKALRAEREAIAEFCLHHFPAFLQGMRDPSGAPVIAARRGAPDAPARLTTYCEAAVDQNRALKSVIDGSQNWEYGDNNSRPMSQYRRPPGTFNVGN